MTADLHFYFDPVCPFAWMTSRWVTEVADLRDYDVDWRFISLRMVNRDVDYASHFRDGYEHAHNAGLRMLRVAARARAEHGRQVVGDLYTALGDHIWEVERPEDPEAFKRLHGTRQHITPILEQAGLPLDLLDALDDESLDVVISAETDEALELTGRDVGTPILHFEPPTGTAFFGPVISRVPRGDEALELWDHVIGLSRFRGFAELKRSLRERPQLPVLGYRPDEEHGEPVVHQRSRRQPV